MPIPLGAGPLAGFDRPLDLLQDCHRRIERFLSILLQVAETAPQSPLDEERRRALETALQYFRAAAPRHTADEERSLFPRLRQSKDPRVHQALAAVEALEADHVAAARMHERVDALGEQWLRAGQLPPDLREELHRVLREMQDLYRQHIEVEDTRIFPLAGQALSAEDLAHLGQEMQARRDQTPGRQGSRCAQRRRAQAQQGKPLTPER